ncbi:hypothetical protein CPB86DRAFT_789786 [Serendipita vermifera]|nr:hypothetical protein CPB86DRAFT_789786 [Serendipita vermifera]
MVQSSRLLLISTKVLLSLLHLHVLVALALDVGHQTVRASSMFESVVLAHLLLDSDLKSHDPFHFARVIILTQSEEK